MAETTVRNTASMEDYLEAIVWLIERGEPVKVSRISETLGVKKPSVTSAMAKLSEAGLVRHEKYGEVELTPEGLRLAQSVDQRHKTLRRFLMDVLGVDSATAERDACKMEHLLSPPSLEKLAKFVDFVLEPAHGKTGWLKAFDYYCELKKRRGIANRTAR